MNSKRIGNIGEIKAISKFVELGIPVYLPFGDNERADMIINVDNKLLKIQVKTSNTCDNDGVSFYLDCSRGHRELYRTHYTSDDIDYFVLYSIQLDKLYMIHVNDAPKTKIYFRTNMLDISNSKIRNSDNYQIDNVLNTIARR